jgi:hypothetical protein
VSYGKLNDATIDKKLLLRLKLSIRSFKVSLADKKPELVLNRVCIYDQYYSTSPQKIFDREIVDFSRFGQEL